MSQFDPLQYPPGEALNPFAGEFRDRYNAIAAQAEVVGNPQSGDEAAVFVAPDSGFQFQGRVEDQPPGPVVAGVHYLAMITADVSGSAGSYTAREVVWDDSAGQYIDKPNGHVWDTAGSDLDDLVNRQGIAGVVADTVVDVYAELGDDGALRWVFNQQVSSSSFWAQITGSASNGTNQWKYAWTEMERTTTGWQTKSGGRSGTTTTGFALNSVEANNDGSGVEGNSIDLGGKVFTDNDQLALQAVRGNPIVRMWVETVSDTMVYSFEYVNAVDGECTEDDDTSDTSMRLGF